MIEYNPDTGKFHRQFKNGVYKEVGHVHKTGYVYIKLNGRSLRAHRLAFELMGVDIPEEVDHINRVRHDNRWCNLRSATASDNQCNSSSTNLTGVRGVWRNHTGYQARVQHRGKRYQKGFKTLAAAADWTTNLRSKLHGEFACHT